MLSFWKIQWPIYHLKCNPQRIDNMLVVEDNDGNYKVIDNMNMPGHSLGVRRLQHLMDVKPFQRKLFKLSRPSYSLSDMLHRKINMFIDSSGKIYNHVKTTFVPVETYKLKSFVEYQEGYVLYVQNLHCRFFINRAPNLHEKYVQVLRVGRGFVMYGLIDKHEKTRRIKI